MIEVTGVLNEGDARLLEAFAVVTMAAFRVRGVGRTHFDGPRDSHRVYASAQRKNHTAST